MALSLECVECARAVAASAVACPNCGAVLRELKMPWYGWMLVASVFLLAALMHMEKEQHAYWGWFLLGNFWLVTMRDLRPTKGATRPVRPAP